MRQGLYPVYQMTVVHIIACHYLANLVITQYNTELYTPVSLYQGSVTFVWVHYFLPVKATNQRLSIIGVVGRPFVLDFSSDVVS